MHEVHFLSSVSRSRVCDTYLAQPRSEICGHLLSLCGRIVLIIFTTCDPVLPPALSCPAAQLLERGRGDRKFQGSICLDAASASASAAAAAAARSGREEGVF